MSGYTGFKNYQDTGSDFDAQSFLVNQIINRLATTTLVRVAKVTNLGEVAPVGFVDVFPLINQTDGAGNPVQHGIIHSLPFCRVQGGTDAIILDPKVGDIGIALFCSRDISAVKRTKAQANPGSNRKYDWSDGLYVGGVLNGVPTQYVRFTPSGISITSPTKVTITAPNIEIDGNVAINGATATTGTLTNNGHDVGSGHRHSSSGGTGTGGPPL